MEHKRRRLLFVTDVFPFPLDRGQRVRVKNLLEACSCAFDVTFVGPPPVHDSDRDVVEQHCARCVYLRPAPRGLRERVTASMRAMRMTRTFPRPWNDSHNLPFVNALHLA